MVQDPRTTVGPAPPDILCCLPGARRRWWPDGASRYLRPRAVWLGLRLHEARVALRLFLRSDGAARYSLPFAPGPRPAAGISTKTDSRARVRDGAMGAVSFRRPRGGKSCRSRSSSQVARNV